MATHRDVDIELASMEQLFYWYNTEAAKLARRSRPKQDSHERKRHDAQ